MKNRITFSIVCACLFSFLPSTYAEDETKLLILHTNDTHSRIEPMPANDKNYPELGGYQRRANLVKEFRQHEPELLLLDAGDFCQGTPYFNLYKGLVEVQLMNAMNYHAATLGNHEFDNGLDDLKAALDSARFPIVCCNLDFSATVLKDLIRPYIILKDVKGLKVGILGATINPEGLVAKENYEGVKTLPTLETVNHYADLLRNQEGCDLVICLSHLGLKANEERKDEPYDLLLAEESTDIDIIIGGHSHIFLEEPLYIRNQGGKDVLVTQQGRNGIFVGKLEVSLEK